MRLENSFKLSTKTSSGSRLIIGTEFARTNENFSSHKLPSTFPSNRCTHWRFHFVFGISFRDGENFNNWQLESPDTFECTRLVRNQHRPKNPSVSSFPSRLPPLTRSPVCEIHNFLSLSSNYPRPRKCCTHLSVHTPGCIFLTRFRYIQPLRWVEALAELSFRK